MEQIMDSMCDRLSVAGKLVKKLAQLKKKSKGPNSEMGPKEGLGELNLEMGPKEGLGELNLVTENESREERLRRAQELLASVCKRTKLQAQQLPPPLPEPHDADSPVLLLEDQPHQVNIDEHDTRMVEEDEKSAENVEEVFEEHVQDAPEQLLLTTPPLLNSFQTHVANFIWRGTERAELKCHNHIRKLLNWTFDNSAEYRPWRRHFRRPRLLRIRNTSYKYINKNLLAAFVERWHPETNSFHFPFGEMTITLDDVHCITGLSVEGLPVQSKLEKRRNGRQDVMDFLGVKEDDVKNVLRGQGGSTVKLEWLRSTYMQYMTSEDDESVLYAARAYVMYTFGCSLFADKSGTYVSTDWLEYLEDMESMHMYAWGAATLAYLYRQLGLASRFEVKQMAGYLTLFEAWIYEHFPTLIRPPNNMDFETPEPLAMRWAPKSLSGSSNFSVQTYREHLDAMAGHEVNWNPYASMRDSYPIKEVAYFRGCIVCGYIVEPYMPDRVLRQYGYVQTIPERPLASRIVGVGANSRKTKHVWGALADYFNTWDMHLLSIDKLGRPATPQWECVDGYLEWLSASSHLRVSKPYIRQLALPKPTPESN